MTQQHHHTLNNNPKHWLTSLPKLTADSNKYTRGHTTIVGGCPLTGETRLSGDPAFCIDTGLA